MDKLDKQLMNLLNGIEQNFMQGRSDDMDKYWIKCIKQVVWEQRDADNKELQDFMTEPDEDAKLRKEIQAWERGEDWEWAR